eukprot:11197922-Lingulodinium_polyedra.AAC.1
MENVEQGVPRSTTSARPEVIQSLHNLQMPFEARSWRGSPTASGALAMSTPRHSHPTARKVAASPSE